MTVPPLRTIGWFYTSPGDNGFQIVERVRQTFWDARCYNFWFDASKSSAPYKVSGHFADQETELEWEPAKWLRVRSKGDSAELKRVLSYVIAKKPALRYQDSEGYYITEWRLGDLEARWKEVSGNPVYQKAKRL